MATIITEIYISIDNLEFTKLDLFKDESFTIKHSKKDLQDITKVFAPFSQNFSIPATPKNKQAFGFFGNTEVIKINPDSKFNCKVYTNGVINQTGILKLESVKYKNNKADSFTANFNTNLLSLKDRIGDTSINELDFNANFRWSPSNIFARLKGTSNIVNDGIDLKFFIPLVSNNRVLYYDSTEVGNDNVAFKTTNDPKSNRVLNMAELRPCVSVLSLLNIIKNQFGLTINTPLESKDELKDAYMWCNGTNFALKEPQKFIFKNQYLGNTGNGTAIANFTDSSVKLTKDSDVTKTTFRLKYYDLICGDENEKTNVTFSFVKKSTLETVITFDFEAKEGYNEFAMVLPKYLYTGSEFEFYVYAKFEKPIFYRKSESSVRFWVGGLFALVESLNNLNYVDNNNGLVSLIKSLPNIKVIDFLTSYFKTFNISIYDSSPNDENLFWLTPQDIDTTGQVYSKLEVDYTRYADVKEVVKSVNNPYNYYNFKLKESNYKSNSDFKKQFGIEYGQTNYPSIKPSKANEFKVETEFSIVPPVLLNGTNQIWTFYGFTADAPDVIDNEYFRYNANLEEATLFYSHGNTAITDTIGVQNNNSSNILQTSELTSYIKVMPFCKTNGHTLSFSILAIQEVEYPNTLFQLYYSKFISRLLNPNALSQTYTLVLPSTELYLNDATISAGTGNTPTGFRLQNEIIIGETKFEILEANIDNTTGKSKLTLLNF